MNDNFVWRYLSQIYSEGLWDFNLGATFLTLHLPILACNSENQSVVDDCSLRTCFVSLLAFGRAFV